MNIIIIIIVIISSVTGAAPCVEPIRFISLFHLGRSIARGSASANGLNNKLKSINYLTRATEMTETVFDVKFLLANMEELMRSTAASHRGAHTFSVFFLEGCGGHFEF